LFEPPQRLRAILIAADQAVDIDASDRAGHGERLTAARRRQHADGNERPDRHQHRSDTPERKLAAHPAAVDDHIGIKRHRNSPEAPCAFCIRSVDIGLSEYINCDAI
jgi:hypothetical protein